MTDFSRTKPTVKREDLAQHCSPLWVHRESEGCISALLHKSVTHTLNLQHLTLSFMCIMSEHPVQKDWQRTFHIRHLLYFIFLPTLVSQQRVSHSPFSNNVSYAFYACLLRAGKVLPIQGFPFCITLCYFHRIPRYYTTDKGQR